MIEQLTRWFILAGVVFYIVWDFVAFYAAGGKATESVTVGTWMTRSLWITAAVFGLVGHLAASGPPGAFCWKHVLAAALSAVLSYWLTAARLRI